MLKILLATSAAASMLAVSAYAQNAPTADTQPSPPAVQVPATPDAGAGPIVPDSAQDDAAPAPADNMAADPAAPAPADSMAAQPAPEETLTNVDIATLSADQLVGAKIRTSDQAHSEIAEVQDVLFSADNKLDHVVARFGGFLGFGESMVLLDPGEVSAVKDQNGTMYVLTTLTPEELKARPEYKAPEAEPEPAPANG